MREKTEIVWDNDSLPEKNVIGEKAYNLMVMKKSGIPIPPFFTVIRGQDIDKSLEKIVDNSSKIPGDLMIRSCHPMEGGKHPFSGIFASEWAENSPDDIKKTFSRVVKSAFENRVEEYVLERKVEGFNSNDINVVMMQAFPHIFFGMYITSLQSNPDEMMLNYYDKIKKHGSWFVFDKKTGKPKKETLANPMINQFGLVGKQIEEIFGKPVQIEGGINDEGLLRVFQAKEIDFDESRSLARLPEYKTMALGLHAEGFGSVELPALVLDKLDNAIPDFKIEKRQRMDLYRGQIETFMQQNEKYVVVLKLLDDHFRFQEYTTMRDRDKTIYDYFNRILKNAVVQIRDKAQGKITHEDWDNIEKGGITVQADYEHEEFMDLFQHHRDPLKSGLGELVTEAATHLRGNLTPINLVRRRVYTGDKINVLSNKDGVFVW